MTAPIMAVTGLTLPITSGDTTPRTADGTDYSAPTVNLAVTHTFTIANTGDADLNVGTITVPSGYTVTDAPASVVAASASTTFDLRIDATATGTYSGTVSIASDDAATPYTFDVTGRVLPAIDMIADGADNLAGLTEWYNLSPPLFVLYKAFPLDGEWHDAVGSALDGNLDYKTWGKPWARRRFAVLTQAEVAYVAAHFGSAVTVRCYDRRTQLWANYNAKLIQPPDLADTNWLTWDSGKWRDVRYDYKLMTVIP